MLKGRIRTWATALVLGVALLGIAWTLGYGGLGGHRRDALPPADESPARDPAAVAVTDAPVERRAVSRTIETVGTLNAFEQVTVSAKVEGRVRRVVHDVGDRIEPGALLLEIDPTDYELSIRQAQRALDVELAKLGLTALPDARFDVSRVPSVVQSTVRLTRAKERVERAKVLVERSAVSRDDLSNIASEFQSLQAEHDNQVLLAKSGLATIQMKKESLAIVRQQLAETRIEAPRPSTVVPEGGGPLVYAVIGRNVAEGTFLRTGTEVFKLVIDRPLKLKVPVPDRYVAALKEGQTARVTTAAYDRAFEGTVARINPAVDSLTRTFEVELRVPNADGALKSGSFAKADITTRVDPAAATVPLESIVRFAGVTKLFVIEGSRAREVQVELGVIRDGWVEIAGPKLPEGARVVTSGQGALADGSSLFVRPPRRPDAAKR